MYAERMIIETDQFGQLKVLPKLPANKHIEAIFLVINSANDDKIKRQPHKSVAGKIKLNGDLINTLAISDWDLS